MSSELELKKETGLEFIQRSLPQGSAFEVAGIKKILHEHAQEKIPLICTLDMFYKASLLGANPFLGDIMILPTSKKDLSGQFVPTGVSYLSTSFVVSKVRSLNLLKDEPVFSTEVEEVFKDPMNPIPENLMKALKGTVTLYRKDLESPIVYSMYFHEVASFKRDGELMALWKTKPYHMFKKAVIRNTFLFAFREFFGSIADETFLDGIAANPKKEEKKETKIELPKFEEADVDL